MNFSGEFEGSSLTSIFQLLCNDLKTGLLTVASGEKQSKVYFDNGTIVYANSTVKSSRLGFLIKDDGIITTDQLKECLVKSKEQQQSLGKTLVENGYISEEILEKYNNKQVEDILYNLLFWKQGKFEYKDTSLNLEGIIVTRLNPMKLILEASRRMDEMSILSKVIPDEDTVFEVSRKIEKKEDVKLNPEEWKIVSLVDGVRSVGQIIDMSTFDEFTVYKILYAAISYGVLSRKEGSGTGDSGINVDYSTILTSYDEILQSVRKSIQDELGDRTLNLLEECKKILKEEYQLVLKNYKPGVSNERNKQLIIKAFEQTKGIQKTNNALIRVFNEYCFAVLRKAKEILGPNPLASILDGIEQVILYIRKSQKESPQLDYLIKEMEKSFIRILR